MVNRIINKTGNIVKRTNVKMYSIYKCHCYLKIPAYSHLNYLYIILHLNFSFDEIKFISSFSRGMKTSRKTNFAFSVWIITRCFIPVSYLIKVSFRHCVPGSFILFEIKCAAYGFFVLCCWELHRLQRLKADLDGTTFAYQCRMRFIERALLASCKKSHTTLVTQHCL